MLNNRIEVEIGTAPTWLFNKQFTLTILSFFT